MSSLRARLQQRSARFGRLSLGAEIALIVLFKLILLYALYRAFFSAPLAVHMHMSTASVEQHLLAPTIPSQHLLASTIPSQHLLAPNPASQRSRAPAAAQPLPAPPDSPTLQQGHP